jgi:hypothetical protein
MVTETTKRHRVRRIPTAVLVSVVGIALTAWLLPALTRQWDDRQKAHALEAAIVAEISAATAHALTQSRDTAFEANAGTSRSRDIRRLGIAPLSPTAREWSVNTLQIEAKLRAYFSPRVVSLWRIYSTYMNVVIADTTGEQASSDPRPLFVGSFTPAESEAAFAPPFAAALPLVRSFELAIAHYHADSTHRTEGGTKHLQSDARELLGAYLKTADEILTHEQTVARGILADHPKGYSTSFHDFLRNLVP